MGIEKLDRFINNENRVIFNNYTLDNIKLVLKYFKNPEKGIKTVHIAGTNGKGSVAYMLNSIFISSGYRTGLYTSPHLVKVNERIKVDGADIPDVEIERYIDEILGYLDTNSSVSPTYFDFLTVIAFKYFFHDSQSLCYIIYMHLLL